MRHHLDLMPPPPKAWHCGICGRPEERYEDAPCERCGAMMHWRCYWPAALTDAERAAFQAAADEANTAPTTLIEVRVGSQHFEMPVHTSHGACDDYFDRLIILCPGCRS